MVPWSMGSIYLTRIKTCLVTPLNVVTYFHVYLLFPKSKLFLHHLLVLLIKKDSLFFLKVWSSKNTFFLFVLLCWNS